MQVIHKWAGRLVVAGLLFGVVVTAARADDAACEPAKLASKYPGLKGKTIKIGQDGESPPFSMRDPKDFNQLIGLDADMARAVFACAGVPVEFTTGQWSGLIPATMAGRIDVMWDQLLYTAERAKRLDFIAYMNSATGMLVAKGNPKHIKGLDTLCGLQATAALGTTQEAMLREASAKCTAAGKPAVEVITSPDIPSQLRLVQAGRADVLAGNKFVVDAMAAANSGNVESAFDITTGAKLAAGTAKG
ncbi:MAG: extracellular solute-binding protein family 3, partial [Herbaspirillum sp.]|nr:extracellular solute-binding protein family 3 [Herbaspirillum sp.]